MTSKKQLLKNWKIYAVLDDGIFPDSRILLKKFSELAESPVDIVQLRFKNIQNKSIFAAAQKIIEKARKKNLPVVLNDRPDLALLLGCSGVHLGKGDISPGKARKVLGKKAIIGCTIRTAKDLKSISSDVDYVSIGPVFKTPLKPGLKARTSRAIKEVVRASKLPVVAIGGINLDNAKKVLKEGIKTVAFVRYAITQKNTKQRIEKLRKILEWA
jgi:thiamine-phosphate pyrophosphorylase